MCSSYETGVNCVFASSAVKFSFMNSEIWKFGAYIKYIFSKLSTCKLMSSVL